MLPEDKKVDAAAATDDENTPAGRSKVNYWLKWVTAAKKAADLHWKDSKAAYAAYELDSKRSTDDTTGAGHASYPIYWVASTTVEPAYYSRTPKVIARRRYGIENPLALTMGLIAERLGQYLIDNGNFDDTMVAARNDFMHAAKATAQIIYTATNASQRVPLTKIENQFMLEDGSVYGGEVLEAEGQFFYEQEAVDERSQRVFAAPAPFDEVIHSPEAKTFDEITEIGFKFCLDKEEAEARFNPDGTKSLPYVKSGYFGNSNADSDDDGKETDVDSPGLQLHGYEIYCKKSKKIYWVCESYKDDFLAVEDDPYQLQNFFPCPKFALQNRRRKSLYPTPVFVYLESTANQLNKLYERVFTLVDAVKRRALVYGLSAEVVAALNNLKSAEFIIVSELADILDKGGIEECIHYLPVKELVDAIAEAIELENHFKNNFYEWIGVPEILRGILNPEETATGQNIAADSAHDRFKYNKKQMVDLARDLAQGMLDMALKVFSADKIAKIVGFEFFERGTPAEPPSEENPQGTPAKPSHYELFPEALARLKDDETRLVSIDFETDSTSFRDEAREMARQKMIADTVIQGLATIGSIENYEFMQTALSMLLAVLESMGGSSQAENMIKRAVSDLEKRRKAPPPPPEPNVEMLKVEVAGQKNQLQAQKQQVDAALAARELDIKGVHAQIETFKAQSENRLSEYELQMKSALDEALLMQENQRIAIEQFKAQINAQEAMLEEMRLKQEADLEGVRMQIESSNPPQAPEPKIIQVAAPAMPPMNFNIEMPKPGKKTATIIREDGTVTKLEVEEAPGQAPSGLLPLG